MNILYSEPGQDVPLVLLQASPGDSQDFEAVIRVAGADMPFKVCGPDVSTLGRTQTPTSG